MRYLLFLLLFIGARGNAQYDKQYIYDTDTVFLKAGTDSLFSKSGSNYNFKSRIKFKAENYLGLMLGLQCFTESKASEVLSRSNHTGTQNVSTITGLSTVATSGSYNDLSNKPSLFSGSYTDLTNKPYARVTGSNATSTSQSLADVTGLSVALSANSVYYFTAYLSVQSSSTAGNQYAVNYSAAGATIEAQIMGTLTATSMRMDRISALNTAAPALVTVAATGGVWINGTITTGANAGNLVIRHLKVTSGTSTVFINSYLEARKL